MAARSYENIVSSYFYYMWNAWSEEECRTMFGPLHKHFWEKWCHCVDRDLYGAAERFYAELSDSNRQRLVERACELYDGKAECKTPNCRTKQPDQCPRRPVKEYLENRGVPPAQIEAMSFSQREISINDIESV